MPQIKVPASKTPSALSLNCRVDITEQDIRVINKQLKQVALFRPFTCPISS